MVNIKDPNSSNKEQQPEFANNKYRSLKPEILVLEGVCTHLDVTLLINQIPLINLLVLTGKAVFQK